MAASSRDIYQRFELQVRTPAKRTLLDAFLPAPETLESSVTPPAPPPMAVPEMSPEEMTFFRSRGRDEEPDEEPKPRPKKKAASRKKKEEEAPKSLQDEIAEFMSRDGAGLAPDDDLSASISSALDPKPDPGKKD